jgi:hypothetical protein
VAKPDFVIAKLDSGIEGRVEPYEGSDNPDMPLNSIFKLDKLPRLSSWSLTDTTSLRNCLLKRTRCEFRLGSELTTSRALGMPFRSTKTRRSFERRTRRLVELNELSNILFSDLSILHRQKSTLVRRPLETP